MEHENHKELAVLVEACKVGLGLEKNTNFQKMLSLDELDWKKLYELSYFHVVYPLFYTAIKSVKPQPSPNGYFNQLKAKCQDLRFHNLHKTKVSLNILDVFREHGIDAIPYKGVQFAFKYFKDVGLRPTSDVDILIKAEDVLRANALLEEQLDCELEEGFESELSQVNQKNVTELNYKFYQNGKVLFYIDLHLNTAQSWFAASKNYEELSTYIEGSKLLGKDIQALNINGDLFTIIIHHGIKERWDILKYICDLTAMVYNGSDSLDWEQLRKDCLKNNFDEELYEGFTLVDQLFGLPNSVKEWLQAQKRSKKTKWYTEKIKSYGLMRKPNRTQKHLTWLMEKKDPILFLKSIGHSLKPTANETSLIKLPSYLYFIYYLIRPFNLVYRGITRKV